MPTRRLTLPEVIEFTDEGYIVQVVNVEDNRFLWANKGLSKWYDHTKAEIGDYFWDGNNGDEHVVHHVNLKARRLVVENIGQREGLYEMWYW